MIQTPTAFEPARDGARLQALTREGVWIGTSSWKYPGWIDQLYTRDRYVWRGRFAESRFERCCLAEYAEVLPTVCVDAAYYKFPDERYLAGLMEGVPPGFLFTFKVTDEITVRRFTNLPRFGDRAGTVNQNFLNADLFIRAFLEPCVPWRERVGMLVFEFSRFYPSDFARGRDFVEALDRFLAQLPPGWPYGVEIRNRGFLRAEYFEALARHRVTHVFNSWEAMPAIGEQLSMPGAFPSPDNCAARFLLRPGRRYEEAVNLFQPYRETRDPSPEGRAAGAALIRRQAASRQGRTFLYVNNRFEGNALNTIAAMLDQAALAGSREHDRPVEPPAA
jgi:uncharacterized protein YecE (DUF72 family)